MMSPLFRILAISIALFYSYYLPAQQLSGEVQDESGEPVPFATIALHDAGDSSVVGGTAADFEGAFVLPLPEKGMYYLQFSAVGYQNLISPPFEVTGPSYRKHFAPFTLGENVEMLDEVVVEAMQSQVVHKADKLVMNVGNTMLTSESNAYEVVKEAPGVYVDQNGALRLNGKAGIKVMIDGRDTYLTGAELKAMLESMPAKNIDQIEVVSNPSAKYDAEGAAGMLNILLTKNEQAGFNGSVYSDYTNNQLHLFSSGANLNFKKGSWSSFANVDFTRRGLVRNINLYREYHNNDQVAVFTQEGKDIRKRLIPTLRLGSDFDLNDRHRLGFVANLSYEDGVQDWSTLGNLIDEDPATDVEIDARNDIHGRSLDQNYNLHYELELDTAGSSLSANFDYVRLGNRSDSRFFNTYTLLETDAVNREKFSNDNPSSYDILAGRLDFEMPLENWNGELEAGIKVSHVVSDNQLDFFEEVDEVKIPMDELSNHFTYVEDIYAAYTNFNSRLSDTWTIQAGLRAEYTNSEGRSQTLEEVNKRNFLNLFPSISIQQRVSDNYQLGYSYSRRINRPPYQRLNPYIFYIDPYTFIQGSPNLRPEYTHTIQLTQTFFQRFNLMLGYDYSTDFIGEVPDIDPETRTTTLGVRNVEEFRNWNARIIAPVQIGKKWSMNNVLSAAYQAFETTIRDVDYRNSKLFFMARSSNRIKLPADLTMEVTINYQGPLAYGVYQLSGNWSADAGLQRAFANDKLSVSLRFQDIFRTQVIRGTIGLGENEGLIDQYLGAQSVQVGVRYNFSKGARFESKQRKLNLEEVQRAGG